MRTVLQLLLTETEVYRIKKDFQTKVKAAIDKTRRIIYCANRCG